MKHLFLILTIIAFAKPTMAQRHIASLNLGWEFSRDSLFTTSETVDVPHDFQICQPWVAPDDGEKADNSDAAANTRSRLSSRGFKEMGCGWYRKKIEARGERVLLDFEGIMLVGDVYLNGERIGGTDYGYVGFQIDITKKLRQGDNTLVVKASTMGVRAIGCHPACEQSEVQISCLQIGDPTMTLDYLHHPPTSLLSYSLG